MAKQTALWQLISQYDHLKMDLKKDV